MSTRYTSYRISCFLATALVSACGGNGPHPEYVPDPLEAKWDVHHEEERAGRIEAALSGYRAMCDQSPPYIRACFDHARLLSDTVSISEGRDALSQVIL